MTVTKEELVNYTNICQDTIDTLTRQKQVLMYLSSVFTGTKTQDEKQALNTILGNIVSELNIAAKNCSSVVEGIESDMPVSKSEDSL